MRLRGFLSLLRFRVERKIFKLEQWSTSRHGKKRIFFIFQVGLGCGFGVKMLGNTFAVNPYVDRILRLQVDGEPFEVPPDLTSLADQEYSFSGTHVPAFEKHIFNRYFPRNGYFFITGSFQPVSVGCGSALQGAWIGIPYYFTFKTPEDVRANVKNMGLKLGFGNSRSLPSVNWDANYGNQLISSMLLSDDAKRFVIQRELQRRSHWSVILGEAFGGAGLSFLSYGVCRFVGAVALRKWKVRSRIPVFAVITACFTTVYMMARDGYRIIDDLKSDRDAAFFGDVYIQGAREYYSKALRRNQILYKLYGVAGKNVYQLNGDFVQRPSSLFRRKPASIRDRLEEVEKVAKHLKQNPQDVRKRETDDDDSRVDFM